MSAISRCWLIVSLALLVAACAADKPKPIEATAPAAPPLHDGPLTDYVPAAGLRWMAVGSPRKLAEHAAFREALAVLFQKDRLDGFHTSTGVDLRRVDSALVASFGLGTLYLWTPTADSAPAVVERFRGRLIGGEQHQRTHPSIERYAGVIAATPEALLTVDGKLIAVAVGDPQLARVVEAFARRKLRSSPPALTGAALASLAREPADSLVTFYAPGPFTGEWERGARGLLASTLAVSISVSPRAPGVAHVTLRLSGDFADDGAEILRRAFDELVQSSFGKLHDIASVSREITARKDAEGLVLDVDVELVPLARSVSATVSANVFEILRIHEQR